MKSIDEKIIEWARERGIFENSDPKSQCLKTLSEAGELADAVNKGNIDEIIDAIGDIQVTLYILCEMYGLKLDECTERAYSVIANRKGKMQNGVFVKDKNEYLIYKRFEQ